MCMNLPRMLAYVPTPRLAAGLAVAVLTVTACGGGGSSSTASDVAVTPNRQPTIDSFEPIEVLEGVAD